MEEFSKATRYSDRVQLIGMIRDIKDSFSSRKGISDDDNVCSILHLNCSINPTSNGKEFVTNFIQLVSPQLVDQFSQNKLR